MACERLRELGERRAAPEGERARRSASARPRRRRPRARSRPSATAPLEACEVELVRRRPRARSPARACAGAARVAPSAAARRGSAPSSAADSGTSSPQSASTMLRPAPPSGSRAGAGPRAAPAVFPPRSAAARGRRTPPAGRGAESPSREAADATTVGGYEASCLPRDGEEPEVRVDVREQAPPEPPGGAAVHSASARGRGVLGARRGCGAFAAVLPPSRRSAARARGAPARARSAATATARSSPHRSSHPGRGAPGVGAEDRPEEEAVHFVVLFESLVHVGSGARAGCGSPLRPVKSG